jgi:hypothetical protein
MKRFIKNRKGTAEVIGTIMFIVILLFFFTNVYLWHDAATKDANELYLKKISSSFEIEKNSAPSAINVTAGGSDIILSRLWIINTSGRHLYADLNNAPVLAGKTLVIDLSNYVYTYTDQNGNSINGVHYSSAVKCTVINTLGIAESYTF